MHKKNVLKYHILIQKLDIKTSFSGIEELKERERSWRGEGREGANNDPKLQGRIYNNLFDGLHSTR